MSIIYILRHKCLAESSREDLVRHSKHTMLPVIQTSEFDYS